MHFSLSTANLLSEIHVIKMAATLLKCNTVTYIFFNISRVIYFTLCQIKLELIIKRQKKRDRPLMGFKDIRGGGSFQLFHNLGPNN